ncbi:hypothetical protein P872_09000 [Rhodonellum psychrophilum GCM71 = DSM 17998]|uniref:Uncharacterized protein n=1 Tax=Rhodonellum psychrophilum GCM71 = DSM 17998 TaxID=1123057 RepID=U5BWF1_9BACT|nr:hypothetical protein P872_09000 [Rhodonellum psychrophilum GCM71 = DSM 17998]
MILYFRVSNLQIFGIIANKSESIRLEKFNKCIESKKIIITT